MSIKQTSTIQNVTQLKCKNKKDIYNTTLSCKFLRYTWVRYTYHTIPHRIGSAVTLPKRGSRWASRRCWHRLLSEGDRVSREPMITYSCRYQVLIWHVCSNSIDQGTKYMATCPLHGCNFCNSIAYSNM